ncbi:oxygen-independent coproporphyrinogen-3 oxidase [Ruminococcaceae bacterium YRB3002]|nr:oxygen-independent coproporphyrinogen-3 oxidase [Ruminococcaceae bacterium YRB3002]
MLEIMLTGHSHYYAVADVLRCFMMSPVEDKEGGRVYCKEAPDIRLRSGVLEDQSTICATSDGTVSYHLPPVTSPVSLSREVKRTVYLALSHITGREAPWGCLTGIRPTIVAGELMDPSKLTEQYFVRPDKAALAVETYVNEQRVQSLIDGDDLNIYVGVPFCPSRCEYCSFVSSDISHHMGRLKEYWDALELEISTAAPRISRRISTLYIGGGTPTVGSDDDTKRLLDIVFGNIKVDKDTEITIEAGRPDTITETKLKYMKQMGITRLCINPQTMNSDTLRSLNRLHSAGDVIRTYDTARETGFDVINMDLIAGLKYEKAAELLKSTERLIELDPANITIHSLYKKRRAGISREDVLANDDDVDRCLTGAHDMLRAAGYIPYYLYRQKDTGHGLENTGFAKPGTECRYNVAMMGDARDVLSFGAGGMSKRVFGQDGNKFRVERCPCIKDVIGYIASSADMAKRKMDFFDIM